MILSSLINNNNNSNNSKNNHDRVRQGTLSIIDKQTSTDTAKLKLHSNSMSPDCGDHDIDEIPHW